MTRSNTEDFLTKKFSFCHMSMLLERGRGEIICPDTKRPVAGRRGLNRFIFYDNGDVLRAPSIAITSVTVTL